MYEEIIKPKFLAFFHPAPNLRLTFCIRFTIFSICLQRFFFKFTEFSNNSNSKGERVHEKARRVIR